MYKLTADIDDMSRQEAEAVVLAIVKKHGTQLIDRVCDTLPKGPTPEEREAQFALMRQARLQAENAARDMAIKAGLKAALDPARPSADVESFPEKQR